MEPKRKNSYVALFAVEPNQGEAGDPRITKHTRGAVVRKDWLEEKSEYFHQIFSENPGVSEFTVDDVDRSTLFLIALFFRTGRLKASDEGIYRLLIASERLGIPYLCERAKGYIARFGIPKPEWYNEAVEPGMAAVHSLPATADRRHQNIQRLPKTVNGDGINSGGNDGDTERVAESLDRSTADHFASYVDLKPSAFLKLPVEEVVRLFTSVDKPTSRERMQPAVLKSRARAAVAWLFHDDDRLQHTRAVLGAVRLGKVLPLTLRRAIRNSEILMAAYGKSNAIGGISGKPAITDASDGVARERNRDLQRATSSGYTSRKESLKNVAASGRRNAAPKDENGSAVLIRSRLMREVRLILNSVSGRNFNAIRQRLMKLNIDTQQQLEEVIDEIVENALGRPMSCTLYAELMKSLVLSSDSTVAATATPHDGEGGDDDASDKREEEAGKRYLLRSECIERALWSCFSERLSEHATYNTELKEESEDDRRKKAVQQQKYLSIIRFLGELYLVELVEADTIIGLMRQLLPPTAVDDEGYSAENQYSQEQQQELEALCMLIVRVGKRLATDGHDLNDENIFNTFRDVIQKQAAKRGLCGLMQNTVDNFDAKMKNDANAGIKKVDEKGDAPLAAAAASPRRRVVREDMPVKNNSAAPPSAKNAKPPNQSAVNEKPWRPRQHADNVQQQPRRSETACKFTALRALLNKLAVDKFDELLHEFVELNLRSKDEMLSAIDVIDKAARADQAHAPLYALLLRELVVVRKGEADSNYNNNATEARAYLLRCLQMDFERKIAGYNGDQDDDKRYYAMRRLQMTAPELRQRAHQYRLSTARWLGELFLVKLVPRAIIMHCMQQLVPASFFDAKKGGGGKNLSSPELDKLECLCMLITTIGTRMMDNIADLIDAAEQPVSIWRMFQRAVGSDDDDGDQKIRFDSVEAKRIKFLLLHVIDMAKTAAAERQLNSCVVGGGETRWWPSSTTKKGAVNIPPAVFANVYAEYKRRMMIRRRRVVASDDENDEVVDDEVPY